MIGLNRVCHELSFSRHKYNEFNGKKQEVKRFSYGIWNRTIEDNFVFDIFVVCKLCAIALELVTKNLF